MQVNIPIKMRKPGLSPEETKEIVSSKIENVDFAELQDVQNNRLQLIRNYVIRCLSYSIRDDGFMDNRRISPRIWQHLEIIPAPVVENEYQIPQREAQFQGQPYIDFVNQTKQTAELTLFNVMNQLQLLDGIDVVDGLLERDGQELSDVELCTEIDNATLVIASWYMQGLVEQHQELNSDNQRDMIRSCLEIAICKIVLMIRREHPLDIFIEADYIEWKSCLGVIASFAALSIVVDFFDDETSIIRDRIGV